MRCWVAGGKAGEQAVPARHAKRMSGGDTVLAMGCKAGCKRVAQCGGMAGCRALVDTIVAIAVVTSVGGSVDFCRPDRRRAWTLVSGASCPLPTAGQKKWRRRGAAKFREETSKKQTTRQGRIAATHNLAARSFVRE